MSLVRPEVTRSMYRWREVLAAVAVGCVGLFLTMTQLGLAWYLGLAMLLIAMALAYSGVARARFRNAGGGRGIVEVDERKISYFGPDIGGAVALDELTRLAIVPPHAWELTDRAWQRLTIPVDAAGAEALFDAFVTLPDVAPSRLADAAQTPPQARTVLWQRSHSPRA